MPQIVVVTDSAAEEENLGKVVYRERVSTTDLESDHFSGQLVQRVGWALRDAKQLERRGERGLRLVDSGPQEEAAQLLS